MKQYLFLLACVLQLSVAAQDTTQLFTRIQVLSAAALDAHSASDDLRRAYADRDEMLFQEVRDSVYLFDQELLPYVDSLVRRIVAANKLPIAPLVLLDYGTDANARSLGTEIIAVNLGMLTSLRYEEELLYVLSHELAHETLLHHYAGMRRSEALFAELQPTLRKLSRPAPLRGKRREYALRVELRDGFYGAYRDKRRAELAADSLALHYFEALGLSPAFGASALDDPAPADGDTLQEEALVRLLETPDRPIDPEWLRPRPKLFGGGSFGKPEGETAAATFWRTDSLSTHPALAERQAAMQSHLHSLSTGGVGTAGTPLPYQNILRHRIIDGHLLQGAYGPALVDALYLLYEHPGSPELRELAGRALFGVYRAAREHDFDEAVPPSAYYPPGPRRALIGMLRRMSTEDLRALTEAYLITAAPLTYTEVRADL